MQERKTKKGRGQEFGTRLREVRESRSLTRKNLAEATGLAVQAIANIEAGRRQPSFRTLLALARGLSMSLDSLVGWQVAEQAPGVLEDATVAATAERIRGLPPELQQEVKDFVDFLWEKKAPRCTRGRRSKRQ